mmetsp:Transcript_37246/g.58979  ORF Transcript_37246/g.58979 Transcript_37246/m.58979 type:complete len:82 (+) Transcript_37246:2269-2514(+)
MKARSFFCSVSTDGGQIWKTQNGMSPASNLSIMFFACGICWSCTASAHASGACLYEGFYSLHCMCALGRALNTLIRTEGFL